MTISDDEKNSVKPASTARPISALLSQSFSFPFLFNNKKKKKKKQKNKNKNNGNLYNAFGNSKRFTITLKCGTLFFFFFFKKEKRRSFEEEATEREKNQ